MGTYTTKFNLYKPAVGETGWGSLVSNNFEIIDGLTPAQWGAEPAFTKNTAFNKNFGIEAETVCVGNDSRLSDSRTPTTHATTHGNTGDDRLTLDTTQVTTGIFDIARIPAGAKERLVTVATDAARFALTTDDVQTGDSVFVTGTQKLYIVIDDTQLSTESGYMQYRAYVSWDSIDNKPSAYTPSVHASTHATGGTDAITPANIGAQRTILYGTSDPTSSQGENGDVYIKYSA